MDIASITQVVFSGIILGGLYSFLTYGLSLSFGIMKVVNFAYGEIITLGMFTDYWIWRILGIDPILSLAICVPIFFLVGIVFQRIFIQPIIEAPHNSQMASTFAAVFILQNLALLLWSPDPRVVQTSYQGIIVDFFGLYTTQGRLLGLVAMIAVSIFLITFMARTKAGLVMRATSQDFRAAQLMGVNIKKVYLLAGGFSAAITMLACAFLNLIYFVSPFAGVPFVMIAFIVLAIGGLGSIKGTVIAGFIVALLETFSGFYSFSAKEVIIYLIFILVLLFRPRGIFGEKL